MKFNFKMSQENKNKITESFCNNQSAICIDNYIVTF